MERPVQRLIFFVLDKLRFSSDQNVSGTYQNQLEMMILS